MSKAIIKSVFFAFLILATCGAINWILIPNNPAAYQAAKIDKLYVLSKMGSPKIVLIGGSNLAFSIDSELLSSHFRMPVINMGLAKSVGLQYLLEEAKPFIRSGDIVVIAPEHELFYDLYYGSDGLIVELQYVPEGFGHLKSFGQYRTFVSKFGPIMQAKFSGMVRKGTTGFVNDIYRRNGFDDNGDLKTHLDEEPSYAAHELFEHNAPFREESIELLNEFYLEILHVGARVVLAAPPLAESEFNRHEAKIDDLYERLGQELSLPVISNPHHYVFPMYMVFDTAYHLLREGRRVRTHQLINDLEQTDGIGYGGIRGDQT
jgi:hypothetical protein